MRIEGHDSGIFAAIFITSVILLPLWVKVSKNYGKKIAYYLGIGSLIFVLFAIILLQPEQLLGIYILAVLAGAGVSAAHVIPYAILPDCIDYGQMKSGKRLEGIYYGFTTFSRKVATSISIFLIGQILAFTGYIPDQIQNTNTLWAFRILLGPVAAFLLLIGIISMIKFPIDREYHKSIMKKLQNDNVNL